MRKSGPYRDNVLSLQYRLAMSMEELRRIDDLVCGKRLVEAKELPDDWIDLSHGYRFSSEDDAKRFEKLVDDGDYSESVGAERSGNVVYLFKSPSVSSSTLSQAVSKIQKDLRGTGMTYKFLK